MGTIADNGKVYERVLRIEQRLISEVSVPYELQDALIHARTVLDVGSGAGAWAVAMARKHLYNEFVGVEEDANLVQIARWHAQEIKTPNAQFACHPLREIETIGFPYGCFGYIRAQCIARALLHLDYAALAASLFKLCKPGGAIAWTEFELPITSSPALQHIFALFCRALDKLGQRYAPPTEFEQLMAEQRARMGIAEPERIHLCITPYLAYWIERAGFGDVRSVAQCLDISSYAPAHNEFCDAVWASFDGIKPFLASAGVIDPKKLGKLCDAAWYEMQDDAFCGIIFGLTAFGKKPA